MLGVPSLAFFTALSSNEPSLGWEGPSAPVSDLLVDATLVLQLSFFRGGGASYPTDEATCGL